MGTTTHLESVDSVHTFKECLRIFGMSIPKIFIYTLFGEAPSSSPKSGRRRPVSKVACNLPAPCRSITARSRVVTSGEVSPPLTWLLGSQQRPLGNSPVKLLVLPLGASDSQPRPLTGAGFAFSVVPLLYPLLPPSCGANAPSQGQAL